MKLLVVTTTVDREDDARRLARAAVERGLAACVQITPIESFFRWDGALQQEREWRLLFKCTEAGYAALAEAVLAQHPYELPALWAMPVEHAHEPYAKWVADNSGGSSG